MRSFFYIIAVLLLMAGCKEPEARRPLNVKTATYMDESVERNKKILAHEAETIKTIIATDTLNTYYSSAKGFWYCYNTKDSLSGYTPVQDDIVLISYNIRTLNNDTLYSAKDIGKINLKIDREIVFPGLNEGLKLMKKGETVTFLFPSYLAYGYRGDTDKIGMNTPVRCTVSLLDIIKNEAL
ncbi:MAG: gliding motility-associated peptidyl-prolyl isomerase GldI [Sinomicrobium sp.]|nr:gliding motility-associated peptidyl-prolyl isomerase GldI [Sinomicrobium sp.]